jgi:hypothetical protein
VYARVSLTRILGPMVGPKYYKGFSKLIEMLDRTETVFAIKQFCFNDVFGNSMASKENISSKLPVINNVYM